MRARTAMNGIALILVLTAGAAQAAWFDGLGHLPGGATSSKAYGISDDGFTVVGQAASASGTEAFRWSADHGADHGMVGLGDFAGGPFVSAAYDASGEGSVIVGYGTDETGLTRAFR